MHKRMMKWISMLLVLTMLIELVPAALPGGLAVQAAAAGLEQAAQQEDYDGPQETQTGLHAVIPTTFVELEDPEAGDAPQLPEAIPPKLTEDDLRYLALLEEYTAFSQLTAADAAFFCGYTGIAAETFAALETQNQNLLQSVVVARLTAAGYSLAEVADLSEEERQDLLAEVTLYRSLLRQELAGTALDQQLRGYLLHGYRCARVLGAYGVSQALGVAMLGLLESDSGRSWPTGLLTEEMQQIEEFAAEFGVSAVTVAAYVSENGLTAAGLDNIRQTAWRNLAELLRTQEGTGGDEEDPGSLYNETLGAPYASRNDERESVALNSGALIYQTEDYVLPGVNGLDLVIGRRYDSQSAGVYQPKISRDICTRLAYFVNFCIKNYIYTPETGKVFLGKTEHIMGPFVSYAAAAAFVAEWESKTTAPGSGSGTEYEIVSEYSAFLYQGPAEATYTRSDTKSNTYLNDLYGLGNGWSMLFSSVETVEVEAAEWGVNLDGTGPDPIQYLHCADGGVYEIDWDAEGAHLKDYPRTDRLLERDCHEFTVGTVSSQYRLTYQNGRQEYFDADGRLIGIRDRDGNTITLTHGTSNGYPHITIIDTLGREVVISGQSGDGGHVMTAVLPDGMTLCYQVDHLGSDRNAKALAAYTDAADCTTHYSYTVAKAGFDVLGKTVSAAYNKFLNLTTITHPTQAQSVYTYAAVRRNLGNWGLMEAYRVTAREDHEGDSVRNRRSYTYSDNDCSGYPAEQRPTEIPENFRYWGAVTDASNVVTTVTFNREHQAIQTELTRRGRKIQTTERQYGQSGLPVCEETRTYSAGNQTAPLTAITAAEYDEKGNLTASWTARAGGDTTDTEHKTSYTYDGIYGLLLTKTYRTDADTTVELRNTLDAAKKHVVRSETYCNQVLTSRTDFAYDAWGNVVSQRRYHDDFIRFDQTDYVYDRHAYLAQERHSGVLNADGQPAAGTPGQSAGTIVTTYAYDNLGRLTAVTDGSGNTTGYACDALGNLTQQTNPDGSAIQYARDYTQNTLTVTDENGAQVRHRYTPLGLEFETVDVQTGGVMTRREYDAQSRLSRVTDYVYGAVTDYAYDYLGRVTEQTTRQGNEILAQTLYAYDDAAERGRYQKVTQTQVGDENAPSVVTTQYTDYLGNVVKTGRMLDGAEYVDTAVYDNVGRVVAQLTAADAAKGLPFTARFEYNEQDQITRSWNALEQNTVSVYDALGRLVQTLDYAGTPTSYAYDALGRLLSQTITIEAGQTATSLYDYSPGGDLLCRRQPTQAVGQPAAWSRTEYSYDSRRRLTQVRQYDGQTLAGQTDYTYDASGNQLSVTVDGSTTSYTYNRFGQVLTETDALGQSETNTYSPIGRLETSTDRSGQTTVYTHDALGRVTATAAGTAHADTLSRSYTKTGQLLREERGWQRTDYAYDALGQVVRVTETNLPVRYTVTLHAGGGTVSPTTASVISGETFVLPLPQRANYRFIGWYSEGKTYSAGEAVEITRDRSFAAVWDENQYFIEYYSNFTPRYEQDDAGVRDEKMKIVSCGFYDEVTILDNPFEHPDETARFIGWSLERTGKPVYKPGDVVQGLSDEWYGVVRLYARWNFPEEIIMPPPEVVMSAALTPGTVKYYAYDLAGNRTDFWLEQDGQPVQTVHYAYDALNRLSTVTEGGAVQASYTYTTTGARASLTYANGTAETYTYNLANWVTGVTNTSGDSVVSSYAYTYYASGNQRSKTDHENHVTTYTYDGLSRLTQESEAGGLTVDYAYDGRGNRSQMTVTGTDRYTVQYTYDANNRLTQEEKTRGVQTGLTTYSYDPNGNLTQRMELGCDGSPSAASFTYDVFGQQATATYNGATTAYTYNAQGIRVAKTTAGNRTDFLLDGGNVAAEQTDGDITTYLRGVNLIARSDGGTTEYYLYNAHGDVVQRTDSSGAVTKAYSYDAFGVEQNPDSTDPNPFRYCGEYYDKETGTYYLRARYYSPGTGRFTQEDTHWNPANRLYGDEPQKINERTDKLGLKTYAYAPDITAVMQSGNLYAYCTGNPVMYGDPDGKSMVLASAGLASFLSAAYAGISAAMASIGAAIASSWTIIGAIAGAIVGVAALGYVIYEAAEYMEEAEQVRAWAERASSIAKENLRDHSVYIIRERAGNKRVVYVGRTSDFARRQYAHQIKEGAKYREDRYAMYAIATGLTLDEARALEQVLISAYTLEGLMNLINSIAPSKWNQFLDEFERVQGLIACAIEEGLI